MGYPAFPVTPQRWDDGRAAEYLPERRLDRHEGPQRDLKWDTKEFRFDSLGSGETG